MVPRSLVLVGLVPFAAATPLNLADRQTSCDSVHFFIARGSGKPYQCRQGALVNATCVGIASCGSEDIQYPAAFSDYCNSVSTGINNGIAQLTAYATWSALTRNWS
ncbi:Uu.00g037030.m01.CDS01 [Anthostomella pinea]|uniref:Uu.00g037030.m01.CDS01 n=1 Tax=Anthostomella pinea TaxID=933095 RepID=A0AAI8YDL1_9PEZI|nr:Uu.00g037030.m01.CDS01 [Anthostomella pinea]